MIFIIIILIAIGLFIGLCGPVLVYGFSWFRLVPRSSKLSSIKRVLAPITRWLLLAFIAILALPFLIPALVRSDWPDFLQLAAYTVVWGALWFSLCKALHIVSFGFCKELSDMSLLHGSVDKRASGTFWLLTMIGTLGFFGLTLVSVEI